MRTYEQQTIWASLDEIRMGKRTVARLSVPMVELYRARLEQGRDAPPVRLARQGDAFVVRDGRHRVAAALAAGHTVIEAEVRPIGRIRGLVTAWIRRGRVSRPSRLDLTPGMRSGSTCRLHRAGRGFDSHRLHAVQASVVSTASMRLLYGRGAGSTPAGGSRTPVAQRTRALPCEGRGRWFESSRAYSRGRSS